MTAGATYFDLGRFRATAPIPSPFPHLATEATAPIPSPFPHLATENFLRPEHRAAIDPDFPAIRRGGSCDLSTPAPGPAMIAAVEELRDEAMTTAVVEKFGTDLHGSLPVKSSTRRRRIVRRPASGSLMPNSRERRVPGARASRLQGCGRLLGARASRPQGCGRLLGARASRPQGCGRLLGARASRPSLVVPATSAPSFPRKRESIHPLGARASRPQSCSRLLGARASRPPWSFPRKRESRHPGNAGVSPALVIPAQSGIRILRAPRPLCRPAGLRPASPIGGEGDSGAGPTPSTFQSAGLESWPDR